jgi:pyridoxal phosphate enzyme (YggS family)
MLINKTKYEEIIDELTVKNVSLVAVSKTKTTEAIKQLYELKQRDFGENYVQELIDKQSLLPTDIRWHFIGHLQTNKAKYITSFIHLIHGVDSFKLLKEINKQAVKSQRIIKLLLQVHIAEEETKFGLDEHELSEIINSDELRELKNVEVVGLMGMASFTENKEQVRKEFRYLKGLFNKYAKAQTTNYKMQFLSMGMSSDYKIAIEEGSNLVRIGSLIFGERN